ncbi:MAG: FecR family protein [Bacteroidales bacterium]|nr:FecR family protein [Bacteroidales bacterium]
MNKEIIEKYIAGRANRQEAKQILEWAAENDENSQYLSRLKLNRLFSHFPDTDAPKEAMRKFKQRYSRRNFVWVFSRVAAILIIPLVCFSAYQYFSSTKKTPLVAFSIDNVDSIIEYTVNPGVKGKVILPDGSEVWLNSHSSLICPAVFGNDSRVVALSGEAFFDVHSDEQRPMYVKTSRNITVKVTGTKFNISTYDNDRSFNLHLISGKVRLINENNKAEFDVLPNQEVYITDVEREFKLKKNPDEHLNTAWKEGYLVFDGTLLSEVIRKMERWYGVNIKANSPRILNERFTAEFHSESLTQVLDYLKMCSGINYLITNENVVLSY